MTPRSGSGDRKSVSGDDRSESSDDGSGVDDGRAVAVDPDEDDGARSEGTTGSTTEATATVVRTTDRWTGVAALTFLLGGVGVGLSRPPVLLLAVVGVAYVAYARRGVAPVVSLSARRELSEEDPSVGDEVTVTVTVTNTGDAPLWDLRLVDVVPDGLVVERGASRLGTALRAGRTARFNYVVTARRGVHEFEGVRVVARDIAGTHERETTATATGTVRCLPETGGASDVPLRAASSRFTGRVPTEAGGEGIEFHATREYRPGDAPSRVDWNRYAATRELATLEFRRERAATVVLLVDVREQAYRAPEPGAESAVARSVEGASEAFAALSDAGNRVGVAGFGPGGPWLAPGAGAVHRERVRRLLATHEAFSATPPDRRFYQRRQLATIRRRAPVDAQFVLFSPVTDDYVGTVARRLQAYGHPVTVVSPDVTTADDLDRRLAVVERRVRLNRLREARVRVVDWGPDEPLAVALDRAGERWA